MPRTGSSASTISTKAAAFAPLPQLSSILALCIASSRVVTSTRSMTRSIHRTVIAENAFLRNGRGRWSWTAVRYGGYIQGTNGESQGASFLAAQRPAIAVNQEESVVAPVAPSLESWHNDIEDFLSRVLTRGTSAVDPCHEYRQLDSDLFMKVWKLVNLGLFSALMSVLILRPLREGFEQRYLEYGRRPKRVRSVTASKRLSLKRCQDDLRNRSSLDHFQGSRNLRSPQDHTGVIHSSNLCTEITLNTSDEETAVCNLGSVVLDTT